MEDLKLVAGIMCVLLLLAPSVGLYMFCKIKRTNG